MNIDGAGWELAVLEAAWVHAPLDELVVAAEAWVTYPCAGHRVDAAGVWWDTGCRLRDGGRFDGAVDAFERAIGAGYRSWPLPEAEIAECWLRAGRFDDADRLYGELQARAPGDVWLYNAAGFAYTAIGDHHTALDWFTAGLEMAIDTGDPERLVGQLDEARTRARTALGLGLGPDDLTARAGGFMTQPWARPAGWRPPSYQGAPPAPVTSCTHCGWPTPAAATRSGSVRGRAIGRNEPCWCGSGRKYKRCCALTPHPDPAGHPDPGVRDPGPWL